MRCVVLWALVATAAAPFHDPQSPIAVSSIDVGTRPLGIEGVGLATQVTVLAVLKTTDCPDCDAALPTYRRISEACAKEGNTVRFVVLAMDSPHVMQSFLTQHAITASAVRSFPTRRTLKIASLPTTIVLDHGGTILNSWAGTLNRDAEKTIERQCSEAHVHHEGGL